MGSAFADCAALFLGNGVLQLINEQDTTLTMQKNFSKTFGALADYGVNKAFCSSEQLESLGLNISDLIIPVVALSNDEVSSLIERSTAVLNF